MTRAKVLRDAAWLTGVRARLWIRPFALAVFGSVAGAALLIAMASIGHKPPAFDFDAFWVAGRFVLSGHAALAYDDTAVELAERAVTTMPPGYLAFYYPPPFLMLCAPLGLFGFSVALALFVAGETALIVACLRRLVPRDWGWLPLSRVPDERAIGSECGPQRCMFRRRGTMAGEAPDPGRILPELARV
jgi:alpha-1,2-mannosyltransferase